METSNMELWALFCAKQNIGFEDFNTGVDILMEDVELWTRRGFAELRDAVHAKQ